MRANAVASGASQQALQQQGSAPVAARRESERCCQGLVPSSESVGLGYLSHSVGCLLLRAQDGFELCIFSGE